MKALWRLAVAGMFVAVLPMTAASAVPVTHELAVSPGETVTWDGTARTGVNPNYNGLSAQLEPVFGPARTCRETPEALCEYALVAATNPVPEDDADGRVSKSMTVTLDNFVAPSPASDFALTVYETDAAGETRGAEVSTSDNTEVPDPDEQVRVTVITTRDAPTRYFLIEVAYFSSVQGSYTGTINF